MGSSLIDRLMGQGGTAPDTGNIDLGQRPSKVDSIMQSGNKVDAIMQQGGLPYDPNRLAPRQVDVSQIPEESGLFQKVLEHIAETLKEQGLSAIQFGKYSIQGGLGSVAMPVPSANSKVFQDAQAASAGDLEAQTRIRRGLEGAALVGSVIAGEGALAALKPATGVAAPVLRRFAAWLGAQEAAAVTYGSIQPLDDKQSRAEAIAQDMRDFPVAGAVMHGIFKGVGRLFKGFYNLDPTIGDALKGVNQKQADDIGKRTLQIINEVGDVPPNAETVVHSEALAQATKEVLRLKPIPEEVVQRGFDDLRANNLGANRTVHLAALAERARGRPLTRAEYAQFAQDVSEDGEYLALRKWGEAPVRTPPSATAKMAEQPTAGGEPDFTVEINKQPVGGHVAPKSEGYTGRLGSLYDQKNLTEAQFRQKRIRQINNILAKGEIPGIKNSQNPRPEPTPLTSEVRTQLEAELERLKSGGPIIKLPPEEPPASPAIPPTPPPAPGPLNKVTGRPLSERDLMAEMGGTPNYEDYIGRASGRIATQTAQDIVGQDIPKGITSEVPPEGVVSKMRTGEGQVGAGFDPSLFKKLGANMYKGDVASVAGKEGLQNALDAIRGMPDGEVSIDINPEDNTITIKDNGTGMTPDIAANQFMDVGGSAKSIGSSGGYGLAKVGLLSNAEKFIMTTVANTAEGRVMTTISGSALDWASGKLSYKTEPASGLPTGTNLQIKFEREANTNWNAAEDFLKQAIYFNRAKAKINGTYTSNGYSDSITEPYRAPTIREDNPVRFENDQAVMTIYSSNEERDSRGGYVSAHILNTGAYQFKAETFVESPNVPKALVVDVVPKVGVDSPNYPFTTSREELKGGVQEILREYLNNITVQAAKNEVVKLKKILLDSPKVPGTNWQVISSTVSTPLLEEIASRAYAKELIKVMDLLTQVIHKRVNSVRATAKPRFGGLGLEKEYLGVNILTSQVNRLAKAVGQPDLPYTDNVIFYNPFSAYHEIKDLVIPDKTTARIWAEDAWGTLLHEVNHQLSRGHNEEFVAHWTRTIGAATQDRETAVDALQKIFDRILSDSRFIADHGRVQDEWGTKPESLIKKVGAHQGVNILGHDEGSPPAGGNIPGTALDNGGGRQRGNGRTGSVQSGGAYSQELGSAASGEGSQTGRTDLEDALDKAQANPSAVTTGAAANVASDRVVAETHPTEIMDDEMQMYAAEIGKEWPDYADQRPPASGIGPTDSSYSGPKGDGERLGGMSDEDLGKVEQGITDFMKSDLGGISARAATRIAALSLSGVAYYQAEQEDDPRARAILNYVGGILALGAMADIAGGKATSAWLRESKYSYALIKSLDLPRIASDGTMKGVKDWQAVTQQGKAFAKLLENKLRPVFPDKLSREAAMFSLDEGPSAPEWATLTPEQQREVIAQSILNNQMGRILVQKGIISGARVHYVRHLFQDYNTQHLWYSAWEALGTSGQFAKQRQFETLREAIKWAKANGKSEPVMDPAVAQAYHMIEVTKALANKGLVDKYTQLGLLKDFDPNIVAAQGKVAPRDQLRQVRVPNLGGPKMAPDDAATVLERAAAGAGQWGLGKEYVDAFNEAQSQIMRSIMFWAWEHGVNVLRGAFALDGTGTAYRDALKKIRAADPVIMQASKYVDLFHRPDFGEEGQTRFDKVLASIGQKSPTLQKLGVGFGDFRARGERKLWDEWVPALGLAAWTREMHNWTKQTGGKFLLGSPEFEARAQRAGKFASDVMGKVPGLVQAPQVQQILRAILFSPQWTRGRIALTAHAAGELTKIAAGEINPSQATYLGYKLRSVLVAAVGMAVGSYLLTRKWPKFNSNTLKFYMNSGVKDKNGREIGIDFSGWWQDDLKLLNEPFNYLRDRQNPMLRAFGTQVSGRDVFGRPIQGIDRLDNLLQTFGPPGELVASAGKLISNGPDLAEGIRAASGVAAVGNVSSLPRQSDVIVGKYADKLLRMNGIPNDKDRVFELSQLMRRQYAQTGALYGGEVNSWIAYQRRSRKRTGIPWLWEEGKRALRQALR